MNDDTDTSLRQALEGIAEAAPQVREAARLRLRAAMATPDDLGGAPAKRRANPHRVAILAAVSASVVAVLVIAAVSGGTPPRQAASYQALDITSHLQPSPRNAPQMAYFPPDREIVLFGGQAHSAESLGDTWVFTRNGWHQLHLAVSPPARADGAMAYDPALDELILYGGCAFCGAPGYRFLQDTWAFNGARWIELHSERLPDYEPSPTLAWDSLTGHLELLAPAPGYGANPPNGNFYANPDARLGRWAWTSSGWQWEGNATGPPLTIQAGAFAPEPGTAEILYYAYNPYSGSCPPGNTSAHRCGADPHGLLYSQTWTWNGRSFTQAHPQNAPKSSLVVVADARVDHVVAIDGLQAWLWQGGTWVAQPSETSNFADFAGCYDPVLGDVVVFGTPISGPLAAATWIWNGSSWDEAVP